MLRHWLRDVANWAGHSDCLATCNYTLAPGGEPHIRQVFDNRHRCLHTSEIVACEWIVSCIIIIIIGIVSSVLQSMQLY